MTVIKAPVFTGGNAAVAAAQNAEVLSQAQQVVQAEDGIKTPLKKGFLSKMMEESNSIKGRANAMRTHINLAAACAQSGFSPSAVAEIAARTSVRALEEMGFNLDEPSEKVERALPSICRAMTEAMSRIVPKASTPEALEKEGMKIAQALAGLSRNTVLTRFSAKHYPDDLDAKSAIALSGVGAMATMAAEVERFNFEIGPQKALKMASESIARIFTQYATDWIGQMNCSGASKVIMLQSLYGATSDLYHACWIAEAQRTRAGARRALERGASKEKLIEHVRSRIGRVEQALEAKMSDVMQTLDNQSEIVKMAQAIIDKTGMKPDVTSVGGTPSMS